jgi:hypothetical protein
MKKKLIVLFLLVSAVAFGLYHFNNTRKTTSDQTAPSENYFRALTDVSTWETYTDKKNGFSFKHPKGWELSDITDDMTEGSGIEDHYMAALDYRSPDYKEHYTGGDWGHMVYESGMLVRVLALKPNAWQIGYDGSY